MKRISARDIKNLIKTNPGKAHELLSTAFARLRTRSAVAANYGVYDSTVSEWIGKLRAIGYSDPRVAARSLNPAARKPRARRHSLLEAADRDPVGTCAKILQAMGRQPGESASKARGRAAKRFGCSEITIRRVAERLGIEA